MGLSLLRHNSCGKKPSRDCGRTLLERVGGEKLASGVSLQPQEECDLEWAVPRGPGARGWRWCKLLVMVMEVQAGGGSRNGLTC